MVSPPIGEGGSNPLSSGGEIQLGSLLVRGWSSTSFVVKWVPGGANPSDERRGCCGSIWKDYRGEWLRSGLDRVGCECEWSSGVRQWWDNAVLWGVRWEPTVHSHFRNRWKGVTPSIPEFSFLAHSWRNLKSSFQRYPPLRAARLCYGDIAQKPLCSCGQEVPGPILMKIFLFDRIVHFLGCLFLLGRNRTIQASYSPRKLQKLPKKHLFCYSATRRHAFLKLSGAITRLNSPILT